MNGTDCGTLTRSFRDVGGEEDRTVIPMFTETSEKVLIDLTFLPERTLKEKPTTLQISF